MSSTGWWPKAFLPSAKGRLFKSHAHHFLLSSTTTTDVGGSRRNDLVSSAPNSCQEDDDHDPWLGGFCCFLRRWRRFLDYWLPLPSGPPGSVRQQRRGKRRSNVNWGGWGVLVRRQARKKHWRGGRRGQCWAAGGDEQQLGGTETLCCLHSSMPPRAGPMSCWLSSTSETS